MKLRQRLIKEIAFVVMVMLMITTGISALFLCSNLFVVFFDDVSWDDALTISVIITTVSAVLATACHTIAEHYYNLLHQS